MKYKAKLTAMLLAVMMMTTGVTSAMATEIEGDKNNSDTSIGTDVIVTPDKPEDTDQPDGIDKPTTPIGPIEKPNPVAPSNKIPVPNTTIKPAEVTSLDVSSSVFATGETIDMIKATVKFEGATGLFVEGQEVKLETSDFTVQETNIKIVKVHNDGGNVETRIDLEISNAVAKKASTEGTKMILKATDKSAAPADHTITLDISSKEVPVEPETPKPTDANAKYTLDRVYTFRKNGIYYTENEHSYYDADKISSSSDSSIRQTYLVDMVVYISDENLPSDITKADILDNKSSKNMGSFLYTEYMYDNNTTKPVSNMVVTSKKGSLKIEFTGLQYNGNGKDLEIFIDRPEVKNDSGVITQTAFTGTITAAVTECIPRGSEPTQPDDDKDDGHGLDVETPYVIVSNYGYGGGQVTAGETFQLSMTYYNTSSDVDISNMMITLTMPEDFMLTSSSNTFYVKDLDQEESVTKTVQVTAKGAAKAQSHNIGVSMKYQYIDDNAASRRSAETTENVSVPVVQVDRFELTGIEMDPEAFLGDEVLVTANFVNKGRSEVFNISAEIDGNVKNPGQIQNLGNIASGATGTVDFYVMPLEAGTLTGNVILNYEDTNMELKSTTIPYSVEVMDMRGSGGMFPGGDGMYPEGDPTDGMVEPEAEKSIWPMVAIGVGVLVVVLVVVLKVLKKKREEKEDADM